MIFGSFRSKKKRVAEVIATSDIHARYGELERRFTTPFIEGFSGKCLESSASEVLWILRLPLTPLSPEAASFIRGVSKASSLDVNYAPLIAYGVDARGIAFLITEEVDARILGTAPVRANEVQPLFTQCVKSLASYHRSGLFSGGISEDCFTLAGASIYLQGVVPYIPALGAALDRKVELRFLNFLAPEQRNNHVSSPGSDVYALGVYLFRLISGEWPPVYQLKEQHDEYLRQYMPSFLSRNPDVPAWVGPVIEKCLQWEPEQRFHDANELEEILQDSHSIAAIAGEDVEGYASKGQEMLAQLASLRLSDFLSPMMLVTFIFIGLGLFLLAPGNEDIADDEFKNVAKIVRNTKQSIPESLRGATKKNSLSTDEISSLVAEKRVKGLSPDKGSKQSGGKSSQTEELPLAKDISAPSVVETLAAAPVSTTGRAKRKNTITADTLVTSESEAINDAPSKTVAQAEMSGKELNTKLSKEELIRDYLQSQSESLDLKTWFER
jgi:serine/threonine protein kinase